MPKYCANVGCGWPGAVRGPRGSALAQETPGKSQREPREAAETAQETPNSSCARRRPRLPSASPGASNTPQEAHGKKPKEGFKRQEKYMSDFRCFPARRNRPRGPKDRPDAAREAPNSPPRWPKRPPGRANTPPRLPLRADQNSQFGPQREREPIHRAHRPKAPRGTPTTTRDLHKL